jgi:hypothetical protein
LAQAARGGISDRGALPNTLDSLAKLNWWSDRLTEFFMLFGGALSQSVEMLHLLPP